MSHGSASSTVVHILCLSTYIVYRTRVLLLPTLGSSVQHFQVLDVHAIVFIPYIDFANE